MTKWGVAESNNVLSIEQTLNRAINNGYLDKLRAYGIGRGVSKEEALNSMMDAKPLNTYREVIDITKDLTDYIEKKRKLTTQKKDAVSMGDVYVKEAAPTFDNSKSLPENTQPENTQGELL